ncbi:XrtA system polysaccharide chain length determinant [Paremcibacter congregatus]|uniref:Chain length-determining protein n=1 Tax=Paremcibacter congregatus TaxID=2043170 RepID=A0A2G4YUN9_9PROT|nr:XrtA system polysaccharide chain length determinant [Paremcibacter congregatus]PHZ86059.1 hypothetical protein CRD36_05145 [Paremcibacter congregatus]QDE27025.1 hypothetical protein FIV45_06920 [Paremcibacter congregatus]
MNEVYQQLISILYGVWRNRIVAIFIAWAICIVGWIYVAQVPNQYESEARIHVDAETFLKPLLGGMAVQNNIYNQVAMMRQTLISRPNIEKVIRMTDQDLLINSPEAMNEKIDDIIKDININIQAANLFKISYIHEDPAIAKMVVESLLNIFMEDNLGQNRKDLTSAVRFIEDQIREYEEQLEIAEQRAMEFRQKNMAFLSDKSYYKQLQNSIGEVNAVKQTLSEYDNRRKQLIASLKDIPAYIPSSGMGPSLGGKSSEPSALQGRITNLEMRLDELYARGYKEQHPDVRIVLNQIDMLKTKQVKAQGEFEKALEDNDTQALQASGGVMPNPIYDQISLKLIDLEGEIAILQSRLKQKEEGANQLRAMAHRIPEVEAEHARLNRDYEVIKRNYDQMLAKRESAKISSDLETNTDRVRFRVIDPPQEAREPASPNRLILVIGVLVAGLGAGVGVAFLLSQMHATYSTEKNLREAFSFPVLGSISILPSAEELRLRKRKLIIFSIMMAGLLVSTISVFLVMNYMHLPVA